ncbi:MAG: hypothetical protein ACLFMM_02630 [Methanohalobium sp.]|uniref:hypothetical protein n=1 Tax=Methanohalobium sp. TaxID=2837493 RepID=UPI00397A49EA
MSGAAEIRPVQGSMTVCSFSIQSLRDGFSFTKLYVTSWIKAFIDRLYPYYDFTEDRPRNYSSRLKGQGRKAIVFGICEQQNMDGMGYTLNAMSKPLETLGYEIETKFPVTGYFDRGAISQDETILQSAYYGGQNLAKKLI